MEFLVICIAALLASALTLFSGFGLGTLLMPVVAVFFPLELAIAMTAAVHLANNLFKLVLLGKYANPGVVLRFGIPAIIAAIAGAVLLFWLGDTGTLLSYQAAGHQLSVSLLNLVIGVLIIVFVLLELLPGFSRLALDKKYLPAGGFLSGFFGGLSGHQGAFRSMFLLKAGLDKQAFVATGVVLAVLVDISRLLIYGTALMPSRTDIDWLLVCAASLSAFAGAWLGARWLEKVTIAAVQRVVSVLLLVVAAGLISGLL